MSVVFTDELGWVLSHELFVKNIYHEVQEDSHACRLEFQSAMFKINAPFKEKATLNVDAPSAAENVYEPRATRKKKRRRRKSSDDESRNNSEEVNQVAHKFSLLLNNAVRHGVFTNTPPSSDILESNEEARNLSDKFYENSDEERKIFHGGNNNEVPRIVSLGNEKYVFPSDCAFFNNDISKLNEELNLLGEFDLILLDPPWWNKYIRRKKQMCRASSYRMMYDEDLAKLPIASLTAPGALVAVWCTNSETHIETLKREIFPVWGVEYIGKWYWVKVTQHGEPVCNFSEFPKKQPFEQILFACHSDAPRSSPLPEDGKIVVSVPSAIHSHKPPLSEVLSTYLRSKPKCLELFARYLLPGWTSWGNEVLKLQNLSLYQSHEIIQKGVDM